MLKIILIGTRDGKRVINWPGVILAGLLAGIIACVVTAAINFLLFKDFSLQGVFVALFTAEFLILGSGITRSFSIPIEQLKSLDRNGIGTDLTQKAPTCLPVGCTACGLLLGLVPLAIGYFSQATNKDQILGYGFMILVGFILCCVCNGFGLLFSVLVLKENAGSGTVARVLLVLNGLILLAAIAIFLFPWIRYST